MIKQEMWVLYDENGKELNKVVPRYTTLTKDEYTLGVQIWIKSNGKFLIFKRAANKRTFPNYYEMIGGGIDGYDDPLETALREVREEAGLNYEKKDIKFLFNSKLKYGENGIIYPEHSYIYLIEDDSLSLDDIKMESGENCEPTFLTKEEVINLMENDKFVPVANYLEKFKQML